MITIQIFTGIWQGFVSDDIGWNRKNKIVFTYITRQNYSRSEVWFGSGSGPALTVIGIRFRSQTMINDPDPYILYWFSCCQGGIERFDISSGRYTINHGEPMEFFLSRYKSTLYPTEYVPFATFWPQTSWLQTFGLQTSWSQMFR